MKHEIAIIILMMFLYGCDENKILEEVPLDFYSLENSYLTYEQFNKAVTDLYGRVRYIHYGTGIESFCFYTGTDIAYAARKLSNAFGNYDVELNPSSSLVKFHWDHWYKIIANTNTIIDRIEFSEMNDLEKKRN